MPTRSRTVTFLHTADWQLGKPFASICDPAKQARVQQERFEAIRRISAVVKQHRARFVVVAGDLFDSPTPTHATISQAFGAIADLGVPVYAIPGNHDHAGPDSLWEQAFFQRERTRLAPNFHLLTAAAPTLVTLGDSGDGPDGVVLLPCPLLRRHEANDPTAWIRDLDFTAVGDRPRIVIAHGSTAVFSAGDTSRRDEDDATGTSFNTIALDRLPGDDIDYVALGDWHGFTPAGPKAWYAGTPEIDRFPKSGQEPGHVLCATVGRGTVPTITATRTGRLRWLAIDIALDATLEGPPDDPTADAGPSATDADRHGPGHVDEALMELTRPQDGGEPGFDGCLARVGLTGTVSLAGRAELDRIVESWRARLVRFDLDDAVRIAPTLAEIHDLANRPNDPIISRVATELIGRLRAGGDAADLDMVRQAIFMLHALAHSEAASAGSSASRSGKSSCTAPTTSPSAPGAPAA
jgi:hypothetical protein